MMQQVIKEDLLHYVWKTKQISQEKLMTTAGLPVKIITWGIHNHDSGPDFFNGKVQIGDTTWVGNIEMHIFSSDWHKHSHDTDPAYDNVILHVVYEADTEVYTSSELQLHCIELKDRIPHHLTNTYTSLLQSQYDVPCQSLISKVDPLTISMWKTRLVAERLEQKSQDIKQLLISNIGDWETTTYVTLAKYMGAKVNTQAFEAMARALPLSILTKNNDSLLKVESLLYGTAGMLEASFDGDDYHAARQQEYRFLQKKYNLQHIPPVMWKFSKMRPANFPTVRLAQMAQILYHSTSLFSKILAAASLTELRALFTFQASVYWDHHYRFGKTAAKVSKKKMTSKFVDLLLINVVAPLIFRYGLEVDSRDYCEKATDLLEEIKGESNAITNRWVELGVSNSTALDSQALIHLKNEYCNNKKCLSCNIGNKIVLI